MGYSERFAKLRQMLSVPLQERNIGQIRQYLEEWPETEEKQLAIHYTSEHIESQQVPSPESYFSVSEAAKMLFDPQSKKLFTNRGELLKELCCPLSKAWQELEPNHPKDRKRLCQECGKNVINTAGLKDTEVKTIFQYDPEACIYINEAHGNLQILDLREERTNFEDTPYHNPREPHGSLRIIRTARTLEEINLAASLGFRPLVKKVERTGKIGTPMQVVQHKQTRQVELRTDIRSYAYGKKGEYDIIFEHNYDPAEHFPFPFAAYLIPPDIQANEHVYLEDLIEEHIDYYHQGAARLKGCEAVWLSFKEGFEIHYFEADIQHYMG